MSQVLFDAVFPAGTQFSNESSKSWTHTPVGTPTAIAVEIGLNFQGQTVQSVTYGGVACGNAGAAHIAVGTSSNTTSRVEIWGLANPPAGAQTVVVTLSGADYGHAGSISVTASDTGQCFTTSGFGSATGTSIAPACTCTSEADGFVVDILDIFVGTSAPDSPQTQRINLFASVAAVKGSSRNSAGATTNMSWTTDNGAWAIAAACFKPAGAGSAVPVFMNQYRQRA